MSGSLSRYGMHSSSGAVKGWCMATYCWLSSSHSKKGKAVIHNRPNPFFSMDSLLASSTRSAPRVVSTCFFTVSATMSTTSPFSAPAAVSSRVISSSVRNLPKEEAMFSSVQRTQANSLGPDAADKFGEFIHFLAGQHAHGVLGR